jgi:hypothetical protein
LVATVNSFTTLKVAAGISKDAVVVKSAVGIMGRHEIPKSSTYPARHLS